MTLASAYRPVTTLPAPFNVTAALRQVTNPTRVSLITQARGLAEGEVVIEARLVTPRTRPATLKAGVECALTWAGRSGIARLEPYQDATTDAWRERFGERIYLVWRSDEL